MSGGDCGARCEGRKAGVISEGPSWHVSTLARGEAKIHGRHAVPPLPGYRVKYCDFILHNSI